jgi:hypothetical protein
MSATVLFCETSTIQMREAETNRVETVWIEMARQSAVGIIESALANVSSSILLLVVSLDGRILKYLHPSESIFGSFQAFEGVTGVSYLRALVSAANRIFPASLHDDSPSHQ